MELRKAEPFIIALFFALLYASTFSHFLNGFTHDEFRMLNVVKQFREYGVPVFLDRNYYQHPPLVYIVILAISTIIDIDAAAMFVMLASGFGTLLFFYLFADRVVGRKAAVLGTIMLGTHPNVWVWSNRFLHEAPLLLFLTASLYLFSTALSSGRKLHWLLFGIVMGLGFNLKVSTMLVAPIVLLQLALNSELLSVSAKLKISLRVTKGVLIAGSVAFILCIPYLLYTTLNNAPSQTQIFSREITGTAAFSLPEPWYFYITEFPNFLNILLLQLFLYGLSVAIVRGDRKILSYLIWFIVPAVFFTFPEYKAYRYVNPFFPVLVLFAAYGIAADPRSVLAKIHARGIAGMKRELGCMKRNMRKIKEAYDFLWSLNERFGSWALAERYLQDAKRTGVSAALFVSSMSPKAEKFSTETDPKIEIDLNMELSDTVKEMESKLRSPAATKKTGGSKTPLVQLAVVLVVASFGAWQSLSVVLNDGEWPSNYQAWDYLNSIDSNGVLLAHDYWWAAGFFTDNFVEYLSTDIMDDFDTILRYNAQYIMVGDDTPYLAGTDVFRKVVTFEELNCSVYEVNWTRLREISPFLPFELIVDKRDGTGALWFFLTSTEFSRIPSDGVYRGFIADNTTLMIEFHGICYEPDTIYLMANNGTVYQCSGMWTGCRPADLIRINITGRPCIYHPDFVLGRF